MNSGSSSAGLYIVKRLLRRREFSNQFCFGTGGLLDRAFVSGVTSKCRGLTEAVLAEADEFFDSENPTSRKGGEKWGIQFQIASAVRRAIDTDEGQA